jgi:hypothetical protein
VSRAIKVSVLGAALVYLVVAMVVALTKGPLDSDVFWVSIGVLVIAALALARWLYGALR